MNRIWSGLLGISAAAVLVGCSSYHHHGMMGGGHGDLYWQKGRQDMEALINRTVTDRDKADQINGLVSEIVNELRAGREQERAYHRQLYTLNVSYTAAPEEFTKLLEEANQQRMKTSSKILALRFKMKDAMTTDEWKALTDQMLSYSGRYQRGDAGPKTGY